MALVMQVLDMNLGIALNIQVYHFGWHSDLCWHFRAAICCLHFAWPTTWRVCLVVTTRPATTTPKHVSH